MYTRTALIEERDSLLTQYHMYRRNLFELQEQKAMYGLQVPLHIQNGIREMDQIIDQIEARLEEIKVELAKLEMPEIHAEETVEVAEGLAGLDGQETLQSTVFISYSKEDEAEKNELVSHLGVLQGSGLLEVWVDDRIGVGEDWAADIDQAMGRAQVAILLITRNFLNSKFILKTEVPHLLNRRRDEGLIVFPVIARPCAWRRVDWLARMNVRPKNGNPVWRENGRYVDEELAAIAEEVADIIEQAH